MFTPGTWGRSNRLAAIAAWVALAATSCANRPPPPPDNAPTATEHVADEPLADAQPAAPAEAQPAEPAPTPNAEPPAPPPPTPVALCNRMCDRVAKTCSESAMDSCRMNCTQYEHPPAGCDAQVRTALECASKAEDLTCVNIAPESCATDFRRVVACANGEPEGAMPEDPTKLPDGWQRFQSSSGGFSTAMPPAVTEKSGPPLAFTASAGDAEYEVRLVDAPADKPTQKNLVRVVLGLVGKCGRNLKLFGMVDKPERVTIRYESRCANGDERHGMLVSAGRKMHILEIRGPKGLKTPKDPFFYGFELQGAP